MNRLPWIALCLIGSSVMAGCGKPRESQPDAEQKPAIDSKPSGPAVAPPTPPSPKASPAASGDGEKETAVDLQLFGAGYRIFQDNESRPPQNLDHLKTVISSDRPIDFGRYHIIWGVDLNAVKDRAVLAYDVRVPEKGGMVLFHDGKVERVTADQFQKLPKATAPKPLAERPADVTFTPTEYFAQFSKLGPGMAEQYRGKVVELKGVVQSFRLNGDVELRVISPGKEQEDVRCFFSGGEPWATISKGQQVTVKGFVRSPQGYPMLVGCEITATGPGTSTTITAEELAKEFAADGEKASEKYKGKSFILTGEVISSEEWGTFRGVKLKGAGDRSVECVFHSGALTKERDKKFVPGAKLKMYAEFDNNGTRLMNCELISK